MRNPEIEVFHQDVGKKQLVFRFPNGYGASVVRGPKTFGGSEGLWELAIIKFQSPSPFDYQIDKTTKFGSEVHGHLNEIDVEVMLSAIEHPDIVSTSPSS